MTIEMLVANLLITVIMSVIKLNSRLPHLNDVSLI